MPPVPTQPGGIAPLPDALEQLLEQSRMVKLINAKRAGEGQRAGAQVAQGLPTVKEQIDRALGAAPYNFAGGGIVAFSGGGDLSLKDLEGLGNYDAQFDAFGLGSSSPEALAEDQARVEGIARNEKIRTLQRRIKELESRSPTNTQLQALRAELTQLMSAPAAPAAAPTPTPAAATPAAATPAAATPTPATPAATPTPAARPDSLGDAFRQTDALARLVQEQGRTSPEEMRAYEQYENIIRQLMEEEQKRVTAARPTDAQRRDARMAGAAEGLANLPTTGRVSFGQALAAAGAGAARSAAEMKRENKQAEAELAKLSREYKKAIADSQLARARGDIQAAREATLKAQEIRARLEIQRQDLRLRERQVAATERGVDQRGTTSGFQVDKLVRQAIADVQKRIPIPSVLRPGPTRDGLVKRQIDDVAAQVASLGVTREQVMGYFGADAPTTAPGASRVIDFTSIK